MSFEQVRGIMVEQNKVAKSSKLLIQNCNIHRKKAFTLQVTAQEEALVTFESSPNQKCLEIKTNREVSIEPSDNLTVCINNSEVVAPVLQDCVVEVPTSRYVQSDAGTSFEDYDSFENDLESALNLETHPLKCRTSGCLRLISSELQKGLCSKCFETWLEKGLLSV